MSNSVNFYEFIRFITFNMAVHELMYVNVAFFLVVFLCPVFRVRLYYYCAYIKT